MGDIEEAFEQCPDCGRYLVKLGGHRCQTNGSRTPNREQCVRIAEADPRPDDEAVLTLPTRRVDGAYAYHEVAPGGGPRCGTNGTADEDVWRSLTRGEARIRGRSPCLTCLRLTGDAQGTGQPAVPDGE